MINDLQTYAEQCIEQYNIPALSVAVWKDGQLYEGAAGCLNLDTGVEATTDSIFLIGSATKVFTTCLVMKLVEEGKIELDKPVKTYLRQFQIADAAALGILHHVASYKIQHLLDALCQPIMLRRLLALLTFDWREPWFQLSVVEPA